MLSLVPEERILLLASRLRPAGADIERIEELLSNGKGVIDYERLVSLAAKNGVGPLLYKNLRAVAGIPDKIQTQLRQIYLHSVAANLRKAKELLTILSLLRGNGIEAIPLRGVLASELIFENAGLYYGSDIDILVKPSTLQEVKRILIESEYSYNERIEEDMLSSHYHIVFQKNGHVVEVHWNLVKRYFDIPPGFWWEDTFVRQYEGHDILCLPPEKYLMCTLFRLFSHMFQPLRFFVLVSELSNKYYDTIDWPCFTQLTAKYEMSRLATFTMKLSNDLLGTKIPDDVMNRNVIGYNVFRNSIIRQLFREARRPFMAKLLYLGLLDSPGNIFSQFFGRMWPEKGELRLRYSIPEDSRAIYLYYLLNPLLLPLLLLRRRLGSNAARPNQENRTLEPQVRL